MLATLPEELLEFIISMCVDDSSRRSLVLSVISFNNIDSLSGISGVSRVFRRLSMPFLFSAMTFHPNRLMIMYQEADDDDDVFVGLRRQHWLQSKLHSVYGLNVDLLELVERLYIGSSVLNSFRSSEIRKLTPYITFLLNYLSNLHSVNLGDTDVSSYAPGLLDTIQRLPSIRYAIFARLDTLHSLLDDPLLPPDNLRLDKIFVKSANLCELDDLECPLLNWLNAGISVRCVHQNTELGLNGWDITKATFRGLQTIRISAAMPDFFPIELAIQRHPELTCVVILGQVAASTFPWTSELGLKERLVMDEVIFTKAEEEFHCTSAKLTLYDESCTYLSTTLQIIAASFPLLERLTLKSYSKFHVYEINCGTGWIQDSFGGFTDLRKLVLRGFRPIQEIVSLQALVQSQPYHFAYKTRSTPIQGPKPFTFPILLFSHNLACAMPQLECVIHDLAWIYDVHPEWTSLDFSRMCIVQRSSRATGYQVELVKERLENRTVQDQHLVEYTWPTNHAV